MPDLPVPGAVARAHCERLVQIIHAEIAQAGGWIPLARYMELALYAPGLGYYAAGAAKLGVAGDFTTAPEMTPLFGAALAQPIARVLDAADRRDILELGGGSGRLAASILETLAACDALPERYLILERSPDLRQRQGDLLAQHAPRWLDRVEWLDALPERLDGVVMANEVLDAIAVHVVRRRGEQFFERGVTVDPESSTSPPHYGLSYEDRPAIDWLAQLARERFPASDDYTSEINPAAEALVEDIGRRLKSGAALLIDYGFPAREYYHPQRNSGTLMCHYRHRAHDDPFFYPGLCDITAHVDFTAMAAAGVRSGLDVAGFCSQAPFLLSCGILDRLAATESPESLTYMKAASQVQTLLSPAEMGELFKVLALSRSAAIEWCGFTLADQRRRL